MLIFHANDSRNSLVFMHVPKCAGAAIQTYLQNHLKKRRDGRMQVLWGVRHEVDLAHLTLATAPRHVDWARVKRERYYKVAFVRNPYDRVLSAFAWQKERPRFAHNVANTFFRL